MNIDRLTEIADWCEAGCPENKGVTEFNMSGYIEKPRTHDCGTACCIAGSAIQFSRSAPYKFGECPLLPFEMAQRLLDLDDNKSFGLFYAEDDWGDRVAQLHEISPPWAARCIRKLIATGEVDWVGTRYEVTA